MEYEDARKAIDDTIKTEKVQRDRSVRLTDYMDAGYRNGVIHGLHRALICIHQLNSVEDIAAAAESD